MGASLRQLPSLQPREAWGTGRSPGECLLVARPKTTPLLLCRYETVTPTADGWSHRWRGQFSFPFLQTNLSLPMETEINTDDTPRVGCMGLASDGSDKG